MPGFGGIGGRLRLSAVAQACRLDFWVHSFLKCVVASYERVLGFENASLLTTFWPLRLQGVSLASNGADLAT